MPIICRESVVYKIQFFIAQQTDTEIFLLFQEILKLKSIIMCNTLVQYFRSRSFTDEERVDLMHIISWGNTLSLSFCEIYEWLMRKYVLGIQLNDKVFIAQIKEYFTLKNIVH